jgi:hypothetical protein
MKDSELRELLSGFYEGALTEEQEILLIEELNSGNIPDTLSDDSVIAGYISKQRQNSAHSEVLSSRILSAVNRSSGRVNIILYISSFTAAAVVFLALYLSFFGRNTLKNSFTDSHLAENEALRIISIVSGNLNRGFSQLEPAAAAFESVEKNLNSVSQASAIFERNLRKLEYFSLAMDPISEAALLKKGN